MARRHRDQTQAGGVEHRLGAGRHRLRHQRGGFVRAARAGHAGRRGRLCDEQVVRTIVTEGPARVRELIDFGVQFDEREIPDGSHELDLGKEGGHSKRRILHAKDVTGREIERALLDAVVPTAEHRDF